MTPYLHKFPVGGTVTIKTGHDLEEARCAVDGRDLRYREVYWYPDELLCLRLRGVQLRVESRYAWHGGVPIYVVSFTIEGEEYETRICEGFLCQRAIDSPTDEIGAGSWQVAVTPTLFIALGGAGLEVCLRLRRRLLEAWWGSPSAPVCVSSIEELPFVQFLHIDIDHGDYGHFGCESTFPSAAVRFSEAEQL